MIKKTLCFTNPAYLSLHQCQLVIRLPEVVENESLSNVLKEQAERTIPVEDIGVVVLDHRRITITSGALDALLDDLAAGRKVMKLYKQMKLYNDPETNPVLYKK